MKEWPKRLAISLIVSGPLCYAYKDTKENLPRRDKVVVLQEADVIKPMHPLPPCTEISFQTVQGRVNQGRDAQSDCQGNGDVTILPGRPPLWQRPEMHRAQPSAEPKKIFVLLKKA